ncbi:MAG: 5,6-dimethylbenzimidazole synthase [Elusimicrobia bacterium]|nr:5,6-dimethylbenzimidazole synthase [Elusimicrobiota bacterium]
MELYEAIFKRRDIRQFKSDPIPQDVIKRILKAAHHAGSVGFMQPWNFILIEDLDLRKKIKEIFEHQNDLAALNYSGERKKLYQSLKLEGILDSAFNICVTCDRTRKGPHVIGRNSILDVDIYSTCCAIQNLWLAARSEGVGVGWVSILDNNNLKTLLEIPEHILPVAYLCVGYPLEFRDKPLLEEIGWEKRENLDSLIFSNQWGKSWNGTKE